MTAFVSIIGCSPKIKFTSSKAQTFNVLEATIAGVQQNIKDGRCNCEQLVSAYLKRIEAFDQPTKLNSIILTNPAALESARLLDEEWKKTKKMSPLFCVPVIVKDNYNTAG